MDDSEKKAQNITRSEQNPNRLLKRDLKALRKIFVVEDGFLFETLCVRDAAA